MFIYRLISMLLIPLFIFTNLIPVTSVSAQRPMAFGEMNAVGDVKILSSTGEWVDLKGIYPLLKETRLKIGDGTVFITTKDGSKIDLLKDTEAVVTVTDSTYNVDILNCAGNVSFNMIPSEMLTVITPETPRVIVQKAEVPSPANIRGTVLNKDTGTEIKSIFGKILVSHHGSKPEELNTGDSKFVSGECIVAAFPAGIIAPVVLFVTGGVVVAVDGFRGGKVATPSGF